MTLLHTKSQSDSQTSIVRGDKTQPDRLKVQDPRVPPVLPKLKPPMTPVPAGWEEPPKVKPGVVEI